MIDYDSLIKKPKIDLKIVLVIIVAIVLGFYIVDLMFGKRSFSRMIDLNNNLEVLNKRVYELKQENTRLQKEYFELKELEGN